MHEETRLILYQDEIMPSDGGCGCPIKSKGSLIGIGAMGSLLLTERDLKLFFSFRPTI